MAPYKVQFVNRDEYGRATAVAFEQPPSLHEALTTARMFLLEGKSDVAIYDGKGRSISGNDLVACCSGRKKLTGDLQAEQVLPSDASQNR